LDVYTVTCEFL